VLKWVFERVTGDAKAVETPIGNLPAPGALDTSGLSIGEREMSELLRVDVEGWQSEIPQIKKHYEKFGPKLPQGLRDELEALERRLQTAAVTTGR
jgi:phosphoenolpyruvate carboxykinase (GTP)